MTEHSPTAVVVGAGLGGLVAAAYLARAGVATTVLEARPIVGGCVETAMLGASFRVPLVTHVFYAIDRKMVRELGLHTEGLEFAERDMLLVSLRAGGNHLVLPSDLYTARAVVKEHAPTDVEAFLRYRRELSAFARAMRPLWLAEDPVPQATGDPVAAAATICGLSRADRRRLGMFVRSSASAYLDRLFESDALRAALAFDVALHGISPLEAGSALLLAWRAAQTSGGIQGATAQYRGGPLALGAALARTAQNAGAIIRTSTRVAGITLDGPRATGVVLASGEHIDAHAVLVNLSRTDTMRLLPPEVVGFGMPRGNNHAVASAKVLLGLNGPAPVAGLAAAAEHGRLIIAERPETAVEAKGAALAGRMPDELLLEVTIPSAADTSAAPAGQHVVSVMVPFMPADIEGGWEARRGTLLKRVIAALEAYAPGLSERIVERVALTPEDLAQRYGTSRVPASVARLLASYESRIRLPTLGAYLCGSAAEPADAVSGAGGRVAATLALADLGVAKGTT